MSEMVERVRDAMLAVNASAEGLPFSRLFEEMARAAVAAMREPTNEMRAVCSFEVAEVEYPAMINAALAD